MKTRLSLLLIAAAFLGLASWLLFPPRGPTADHKTLMEIRDAAMTLQKDRDWCTARDKWQELADKAGGHPDLKAEADENGRIAGERCKPSGSLAEAREFKEPNDPTKVSPERLLKHYPAGRVVQGLGLMRITGRGSNEKWVFKEDANFWYAARGLTETKILSNNGSRIEVETDVKEINQSMVVTRRSIKLRPIESPLLQVLWDHADRQLSEIPIYRVIRKFSKVDPELEKTLTWLAEQGVPLSSGEEAQVIEAIDALSGHRFRMEYVSGFGIKTIKVLKGDALPRDDLDSFAQHSGLLLDYVVGEVLAKKVGEEFEVDARQVVRMIGLHYDADVSGKITLKRGPDEGDLAVMSIVGGEVVVEAIVQGIRRRGRLAPSQGTVRYHRDHLLLSEARIEWKMDVVWAAENHLLFGTKGAREIEANSYYEARLAPAE